MEQKMNMQIALELEECIKYHTVTVTNNTPSFSLIFVCQAGDLELMSCILAASIREHHPDMKLIAGIPQPEEIFGTVSNETIDFLKSLQVEIQYFTNNLVPADEHRRQKHQYFVNKIFLLQQVVVQTDKVVFIDSDFILTEPITIFKWLYTPVTLTKICDHSAAYLHGAHNNIYNALNQLPSTQIEVYFDPKTSQYLIQNQDAAACFLAIDSVHKNNFCKNWLENYSILMQKKACQPYFYEQAALLPTVRMLNMPYGLIDPYQTGFKHSNRMKEYERHGKLLKCLNIICKKYAYISSLALNNSLLKDII